MRVFVTGVAGFVGRHLAQALAERGGTVVGGFLGHRPDVAGVELVEADVLAPAALGAVVRAAAPDVVVHLAGLSHVGESWQRPGDYFRVNVEGTENALDAAAGARFVLASSAEVYGPVPAAEQPIREDRPVDPRTPYALTKAAAERLVVRRGGVVARVFNLIGAGQSASFALPAFAAQLAAIAASGGPGVLKVGNLSARRDFVHVADGAAALALLAESGRRGATYNVASGTATSIEEMLAGLLRVSGVPATVETDPARLRPVDNPVLCGDAAALRALGWSPRRGVDEAVRDLWRSVA